MPVSIMMQAYFDFIFPVIIYYKKGKIFIYIEEGKVWKGKFMNLKG